MEPVSAEGAMARVYVCRIDRLHDRTGRKADIEKLLPTESQPHMTAKLIGATLP